MAKSDSAAYLESLERMGMTGHPGGLAGTRKLLSRLDIRQGERALDLGCGTGYTTTLITEKSAEVVGTDLRPGMLVLTRERATSKGVMGRVRLVAGDAQRLPFKDSSFDAAIVESALVFCDVPVALRELHRVLKPGGMLGFNELTILKPIAPDVIDRLAAGFGFRLAILSEDEWGAVLKGAGFTDVVAGVGRIDILDAAFFTPLRTDGWKRYLSALAKSIIDPKVRRVRWRLDAATKIRLLRSLGSGLYTARKPDPP